MTDSSQVPGIIWVALVTLGGGVIYLASLTLKIREQLLTKHDADELFHRKEKTLTREDGDERYYRKEFVYSKTEGNERYYRKDEVAERFVSQDQLSTLSLARDKNCEAHKESLVQIRENAIQRSEAERRIVEMEREAVHKARTEMSTAILKHETKDGHAGSLAAISEIKTELAIITTTQDAQSKTLDHHTELLEDIARYTKNGNGSSHGAGK